MNLTRYISEEMVKLEMQTVIEPLGEDENFSKWQLNCKEMVLDELVSLLETGNRIGNRTKLLLDYVNREKKATTGIGNGIAIPHVRSMQAKEFSIAFARSTTGYEFDSLDGEPVKLFFCMAAPPYDDNLYLKVFKELATRFECPGFIDRLLDAADGHEIIRIFKEFEQA